MISIIIYIVVCIQTYKKTHITISVLPLSLRLDI